MNEFAHRKVVVGLVALAVIMAIALLIWGAAP